MNVSVMSHIRNSKDLLTKILVLLL